MNLLQTNSIPSHLCSYYATSLEIVIECAVLFRLHSWWKIDIFIPTTNEELTSPWTKCHFGPKNGARPAGVGARPLYPLFASFSLQLCLCFVSPPTSGPHVMGSCAREWQLATRPVLLIRKLQRSSSKSIATHTHHRSSSGFNKQFNRHLIRSRSRARRVFNCK
jgi:hypothetical protein